jgi:putative sigma-54 modulation protein
MNIRFLGKNISVTEGMKEHLRDKLTKLEKYAPRLVESHVILKKEKYVFEAEITLLAKNLRAYGDGRSKENIFTAIDDAYHRIEKQLKKFREKVKGHHLKEESKNSPVKLKAMEVPEWPVSEQGAEKPEIMSSDVISPKPMSPEEASMQLEISGDNFLVFLNPKNQQLNVIYKRQDGHHGLIEPEF